jgi:hypothetical protein
MPLNSSYDKDYLIHQTFLGASIKNWNASMGFNSNSTGINITLVEDIQNKRKSNAIDEGYHTWDKDKGFPEGASLNYPSGGDIFYAPTVGEPVYFSYYKAKIKNCGECLEITRRSSSRQGMAFVSHTDTCSDETYLTKETCEAATETWRDINDEASCVAAVPAGNNTFKWTVPSGENKEKQEHDGILEKVFEFNGILKNYKRNSSSSGISYEAVLEDPRMMLEGSHVLLGSFAGTTSPADRSGGMIQEFDNGKYDNDRTLTNGYQGYYNIINAYGYYEYFDFGGADINKNGFSWRKILTACQTILQGKYDIVGGADLERMGGPLYYVRDSRDQQLIKATAPVNVHRYKVDLSELDNLSNTNGGLLPDIYRIKGEKMTLLSLIQNICETAGADFFVELLKTEAKKKTDDDREYSGIIKVTPIPRTAVITPGKIQTEIDTAVSQHACGTTAAHQWANRIISHNMGYEFKDPVSGIMMLGDRRTRVVGVSDIGWFSDINSGMIRERFFSGNEKLREFYPEIEHDGVTFANPGWYHPHDFPYQRGHSYDQAGTSIIPGNMPNSPMPASNDDYLSWGKALVSGMDVPNGGLNNLAGATTGKPTYMPQGTYGDGLLDIFPCWGFLKGSDRFQGPFANINLLQQKAEGIPVMGGFADDDPYNDFDTAKGIFTIFEYYNPYATLVTNNNNNTKVGPNTFVHGDYEWVGVAPNEKKVDKRKRRYQVCRNPYTYPCYAKGGPGNTYRYKLLNQQFDTRQRIYVNKECCVGTDDHCSIQKGCSDPAIANVVDCELAGKIWNSTGRSTKVECETVRCDNYNHFPNQADCARVRGNWIASGIPAGLGPAFICKNFKPIKTRGHCLILGGQWRAGNWLTPAGNTGSCSNPTFTNKTDCLSAKANWTAGLGRYISEECRNYPALLQPKSGGGTFCKNPEDMKGSLLSWDWYIPPVNIIPINLAGTGWKNGPVSGNGNYSHYYYTTVTALRAALEGYESWLEYTIIFEPWLHCQMGVSTCPMQVGIGNFSLNAFDISGGLVTKVTPKINPITGLQAVDAKGKKLWKTTSGRGPKVHSFNRWLGFNMTGVPIDANAGADGRMQDLTNNPTTGNKTTIKGATIENTLSEVFNRVNKVASNFYGKKYLVPLPFTPPEVGQHLRQISDGGFEFESSWTPTSNGWVDIDTQSSEIGKRYPHNINFFDDSGKLGTFAVYPNMHTQIISKRKDQIYFPGAGNPEYLDPQSFHVTNLHQGNSMGGGSLGKIFVEAKTDEQIYWLWNPTTYQIQTGKASQGTLKPYALLDVSSPAAYGGVHTSDISVNGITAGSVGINAQGISGTPDNVFWKEYFPELQDYITAGFPSLINVPLGKVSDGRALFFGDANHPRKHKGIYQVGEEDSEGSGRFTLHEAFFKPWTVGVPMVSNRYRWGPWAEGKGFGKAELIIDKTFAPESFGSFDKMEVAAIAKIQSVVEPSNPQNGWAIESGMINLAGLPSVDDVGNPRIMGLQLMGTGPYVTDVNVSIGTNGVTTTYNMKTQRKKHKLNEIYENRIRQNAEDLISLYQDNSNYIISQNDL